MKRLTQAQKDCRGSRRAGNTRSENLARKLRQKKSRLRERGLVELRFTDGPAESTMWADDPPVYGIYRDNTEWVLTGLSCVHKVERMAHNDRTKRSRMKVLGRYALTRGTAPESGIEIDRFETKADAMQAVRADTTSRVASGQYLVRVSHGPRSRTEEVDESEFASFKQVARRIQD